MVLTRLAFSLILLILLCFLSLGLFSGFSESGKLVQKVFSQIIDCLVDEPDLFYCVLIDEVESIASSRSQGASDPQDAVRVS